MQKDAPKQASFSLHEEMCDENVKDVRYSFFAQMHLNRNIFKRGTY